jgi:hypothetical protein
MHTRTQTARHIRPSGGVARRMESVCPLFCHASGTFALRENNRPSPQGTFFKYRRAP